MLCLKGVASCRWCWWNYISNGVGAKRRDNLDSINRARILHRFPRISESGIQYADACAGLTLVVLARADCDCRGGAERYESETRAEPNDLRSPNRLLRSRTASRF